MKRIIKNISIITITFLFVINCNYGQNGLKFAELAKRLDPYFAKDLITDIKNQLPQGTDYSIWGWDVGDFSGDGYFDVAVSIKLKAEKKKIVQAYLFVDIEGFLTRVGTYSYNYVQLPLEIGVVISQNACFITQKNKQFDWLIRGYTFDNGSLILLDEYSTKRVGRLTREKYLNFQTLQNTLRYIHTMKGDEKFKCMYMTIPSYERGRQIFKGYSSESYSYDIDYVPKGAFYWKGENDASFIVRSAYDNQNLYMSIYIRDADLVIQRCDSCLCDYVDVWFDVIPPYIQDGDRFTIKKGSKVNFRTSSDIGLYKFSFYPGNFLEKMAYVRISTTDELESHQKAATRNIKVVSSINDDGFVIKFKIPFRMLGFEENPVYEGNITELGCSIVFHDIDNEYRPEEETELATSAFSSLNPSTYGSLLLIPSDLWYGETINIYKEDIIQYLTEYGF